MNRRNLICYSEREAFAALRAAVQAVPGPASAAPQRPASVPLAISGPSTAEMESRARESPPCRKGNRGWNRHDWSARGICSQCGVALVWPTREVRA